MCIDIQYQLCLSGPRKRVKYIVLLLHTEHHPCTSHMLLLIQHGSLSSDFQIFRFFQCFNSERFLKLNYGKLTNQAPIHKGDPCCDKGGLLESESSCQFLERKAYWYMTGKINSCIHGEKYIDTEICIVLSCAQCNCTALNLSC